MTEFVPLLGFEDDYEIMTEYPLTIRRKSDHYEIGESLSHEYVQVNLNGKTYRKHRLIAEQFIPNDDPEHKTQVDHINHDKTDYHLSNLRWVSASDNQRNRTSHINGIEYTYVDEIDEDSIVVNDYGKHQFEDYYYDETVDKFYFWNGMQFRELHINEQKQTGLLYVYMVSTEGKRVQVMYSKFKKLYGIA